MGKRGHLPVRMCIACRERRKKGEMLRFTRGPEDVVFLSDRKPLPGRGFYLCPDLKCLNRARKKNPMSKVFSGRDGSPISLEARISTYGSRGRVARES